MLTLSTNWANAFTVIVLGLSAVFTVLGLLIVLLSGFGIIANKLVKKDGNEK